MYQNPVLFPAISNRETWLQIVQLNDDDSGDLITLVDGGGNPLYDIELEIDAASPRDHGGGLLPAPYYDDYCETSINASLADYLSIIDTGTIQIKIPRSVIKTLRGPRSYDVFLTIIDTANDDGRQLFIGRLPVLYGGRNT